MQSIGLIGPALSLLAGGIGGSVAGPGQAHKELGLGKLVARLCRQCVFLFSLDCRRVFDTPLALRLPPGRPQCHNGDVSPWNGLGIRRRSSGQSP